MESELPEATLRELTKSGCGPTVVVRRWSRAPSTSRKIHNLLAPYDSSTTECDGMVRVCHTVLAQQHIEHQPMIGILTKDQKEINPHFWIELPSGERIDYRARMWLGNSEEVQERSLSADRFSVS